MLTAIALPVCVGCMALGIDISNGLTTRIQLQRVADMAALAGASRYAETANVTSALNSAATVAELNGVPAGSRNFNSSNTGLTENSAGWATGFEFGNTATTITATVQTNVPVWFGRVFTTATSQSVGSTAVARVVPRIAGGQACVLALDGYATGVTTITDASISGNTSITSSTCGIRADGSMQVSGNAKIAVPTVDASGTISVSRNGTVTCPSAAPCRLAGEPQIPDPFYTQYYNQLAIPAAGTAGTSSGGKLTPGLFSSSLSFSGNNSYTLQPGIYYVNGTISFSGNASVSGNGVTLISSGGISFSGNSKVSLTAPSTGATAGLLYGTPSSSASVALSGNSGVTLNGAVYAPNDSISYSGNSSSQPGGSTCLEVVGSTFTFSGNSAFTNQGCASLGVPNTYNLPPTTGLVQ